MRTILHLIETSGPGGAEQMLLSMLDNLGNNRFRSIVCLLKEGWLKDQIQTRGMDVFVIPEKRGIDVSWFRELFALLRRERVDLMHAHEFAMNTFASIASAVVRVPCVATVHGKNYYGDKWRRRFAYRLVARHSSMVAVSRDIKRYLVETVGVQPDSVRLIANGIALKPYAADPGLRETTRRSLGVSDSQRLIGAIGNLYPVKGHRYLVEAVARLKPVFPDIKLMIAGRGRLLDELQSSAERLGVGDDVLFLGFRADVAALLQAMDVFVLPSLSEGLPLSLLEAMASGNPVVATEVGGIPEVVSRDVGLTCPPENADKLAECIASILVDPAKGAELGEAGRALVADRFSVEAMRDQYIEVYDSLIEPSH